MSGLSKERINYVTASEVAALFGLSPYKSRYMLWEEKLSKISPEIDAEILFRGNALEPCFMAYFKKYLPQYSVSANNNRLFKDEANRIAATPDFTAVIDGASALIEAKTVTGDIFDNWGGEPPFHYKLQCQQQLMCVPEATHAVLACLVLRSYGAGLDFHHFLIERDDEIIDLIKKGAASFWQEVDTNTPPKMDFAHDIASFTENARFDMEGEVNLSQDNQAVALLEEYNLLSSMQDKHERNFIEELAGTDPTCFGRDLKPAPSDVEKRLKEIKHAIAEKIAPHSSGQIRDTKIKVAKVERKAFTVASSTYLKITLKERAAQ